MRIDVRHPMQPGQKIPQVGLNPVVLAAPLVTCVGGPCDGDEMRCPVGFVLVITNAVDGPRATAGSPALVDVSKHVGGYDGHYEPGDFVLNWVAPPPTREDAP